MRNLADMSIEELRNMEANYVRLGKTGDLQYQKILQEIQVRNTTSLNLDRSISAILAAARRGDFITYGDVAKANGIEWSFAMNRLMPKHLDTILAKVDANGWPLITAIVVNKNNVGTGRLDEASLKGFISGAQRLGYDVGDQDREIFLRDQQHETFSFARNQVSEK